MLDPHHGEMSLAGLRWGRLLEQVLTDDRYFSRVLRQSEVQAATAAQGPLAWNEMFGYEPALALGGSSSVASMRRYGLFVHQALLSQPVELQLRQV